MLRRERGELKHQPSSLLSHSKRAVKFPGRNAVLAVHQHPRSRKPLFQGHRRILKDRSGLERKARLGVSGVALPYAILGEIADPFRSAFRAGDLPVRPADRKHKVLAVLEIQEVDYRVSECSVVAHVAVMRLLHKYVKYINIQVEADRAELGAVKKPAF